MKTKMTISIHLEYEIEHDGEKVSERADELFKELQISFEDSFMSTKLKSTYIHKLDTTD